MSVLDAPFVSETRRNHALEHATIHILSGRFPGRGMAGHSNPTGFFLIGNVAIEDIRSAATEALARLQNGESRLAIHPGCGTNYAVTGALAGLFTIIGMSGTRNTRERLERFPQLMGLAMLAFVLGQPLGMALQKQVTTQADPDGLSIVDIYSVSKTIHRVVTRA
jgi:hypothetical protein